MAFQHGPHLSPSALLPLSLLMCPLWTAKRMAFWRQTDRDRKEGGKEEGGCGTGWEQAWADRQGQGDMLALPALLSFISIL